MRRDEERGELDMKRKNFTSLLVPHPLQR